MVKSGSFRVKIEPKVDFKARFGASPDLADAAFLCLDLARQRHNLVATEPVDKKTHVMRPRRSLKNLANSLTSEYLQ